MQEIAEGTVSAEERDWQKEEREAKAMPLTINGVDLTLGDLFEGYQAAEVARKIKLIELGKTQNKSGDARADLESKLFGGDDGDADD